MFRKLAIALTMLSAVAVYAPSAHAQNGNYDPCAVYPKNWVAVPSQAATSALVAGVAGKAIYICSVEVTQLAGGTSSVAPGLSLWYGSPTTATATACGTNSPFAIATIGAFGGQGTSNAYGAAGGTLAVVPAGAQLCGLAAGAQYQSAIVTYIQLKQ